MQNCLGNSELLCKLRDDCCYLAGWKGLWAGCSCLHQILHVMLEPSCLVIIIIQCGQWLLLRVLPDTPEASQSHDTSHGSTDQLVVPIQLSLLKHFWSTVGQKWYYYYTGKILNPLDIIFKWTICKLCYTVSFEWFLMYTTTDSSIIWLCIKDFLGDSM